MNNSYNYTLYTYISTYNILYYGALHCSTNYTTPFYLVEFKFGFVFYSLCVCVLVVLFF